MRILLIDDMKSVSSSCVAGPVEVSMFENTELHRITIQYETGRSIPAQIPPVISVLKEKIEALQPDYIFVNSPAHASEYAGRLAVRLGYAAYTNVESICVKKDEACITISVYNGNLAAEKIICPGSSVIVVDAGVFDSGELSDLFSVSPVSTQVIEISLGNETEEIRFQFQNTEKEQASISNAENVMVIGHGFTTKEQVDAAKSFCEKTGMVLGGSRPTVIDGLLPVSRLVGISGNRLYADKCILMGVSGASAFLEGVRHCKQVISVNKDSAAAVFKASHRGYAGDCHELLREMNRIVEE